MDTVEVPLRLPIGLYREIEASAAAARQSVEEALLRLVRTRWGREQSEEDETRGLLAAAVESADWWDAEGDQQWNNWQPSELAT